MGVPDIFYFLCSGTSGKTNTKQSEVLMGVASYCNNEGVGGGGVAGGEGWRGGGVAGGRRGARSVSAEGG